MKLNFGSLPFVKASKTVSRNRQPLSEDAPPSSGMRKPQAVMEGMKIPSKHVLVTVRRPYKRSNDKRKRPIVASNLEGLSPPINFKRSKLTMANDDAALNCTKRARKVSGRDITSHLAMLKRKQITLSSERTDSVSVDAPCPSKAQVVPASPASFEISELSTNYFDFGTSVAVKEDCSHFGHHMGFGTSKGESGSTNQLASTTEKGQTGIAGSVQGEDFSTAGFLNESFTDFATLPSSSSSFLVRERHSSDDEIKQGVSLGDRALVDEEEGRVAVEEEEEEKVFPFHLPCPSPVPCSPERFNPRTFGIKMLFPREE